MQVLYPVELCTKERLCGECPDGGETVQGGGELGEYWRLGNSLQSFDVSGRGHVETTEKDEDYAKDKRWKNHPWTDGKDNSQDTENVESDLSKILIVSYIFLVFLVTVKTSNKAGGRSSSMDPISLENLLRMRPASCNRLYWIILLQQIILESLSIPAHLPTGLVSKNRQGALMMLSNILSWSFTLDFMQMTKK